MLFLSPVSKDDHPRRFVGPQTEVEYMYGYKPGYSVTIQCLHDSCILHDCMYTCCDSNFTTFEGSLLSGGDRLMFGIYMTFHEMLAHDQGRYFWNFVCSIYFSYG